MTWTPFLPTFRHDQIANACWPASPKNCKCVCSKSICFYYTCSRQLVAHTMLSFYLNFFQYHNSFSLSWKIIGDRLKAGPLLMSGCPSAMNPHCISLVSIVRQRPHHCSSYAACKAAPLFIFLRGRSEIHHRKYIRHGFHGGSSLLAWVV